jgi:hypothetical protein
MKDETYSFISDVKDKKFTARSARNMRTHCGKGGKVRLPSDNLSKKELQKMNGECKSYRLNSPMAWEEFKAMPDDIKITYIKLLREKFDVPDCELYKMFGTNKDALSRYFKALGLRVPRKNSKREWKKEEWFAWVNGVDMLPAPTLEEKKQIFFGGTEDLPEEKIHWVEPEPVTAEEPEAVVEEDIPCVQLDPNRAEEVLKKIHPSLADLEAELMKAKAENEWLRNECDSQRMQVRILEAQMDVVRLIFGGRNNA